MVTLLDHVQVTQRQGLVLVIFLLGSQHLAQGLDRSRGSMKIEERKRKRKEEKRREGGREEGRKEGRKRSAGPQKFLQCSVDSRGHFGGEVCLVLLERLGLGEDTQWSELQVIKQRWS